MNTLRLALFSLAILAIIFSSCARNISPRHDTSHSSRNRGISIAAANNLRPVFGAIIADFEKRNSGVKATVTFGSSGKLFAQIVNGAPFDLYLSADTQYPERLIVDGHITSSLPFIYAEGRLVLLALARRTKNTQIDGMRLLQESAKAGGKIAVPNPDLAPYGRAAIETLKNAGILSEIESNLVFGENASQTMQFVLTESASHGLLPLSLALSPVLKEQIIWWEIPAKMHSPIVQAGVILDESEDPEAVGLFTDYLKSDAAVLILESYGYRVPKE